MKIFKRVYYPIMAILFALLLIFGFVDAYRGSAKNVFDDEFMPNVNKHLEYMTSDSRNVYQHINGGHLEEVREYLVDYLSGSEGFTLPVDEGEPDDDGNDTAQVALLGGTPTATTVVQNAVLRQDTLELITVFDDNEIIVEKEVNNIITYIPGKASKASYAENGTLKGDVIMFMAHYDSVKYGAMDNASSVATMIENVRYLLSADNAKEFENDLLFVFTDSEEEGMYGAYAFANQFKGFDDVYSRVKLGTNFDSLGNGGSLVMFQSNENNRKLIASYAGVNGGTFVSSVADFVYNTMSNFTDFEIYGDIPSLNFANVGGTKVYHSAADSLENVNPRTLKEQAYMMYKLYNEYGDSDLDALNADGSAVFFSYLDIMTVAYPSYVSYIIGGVTILLLAAIVTVNQKKKAFKWGKTLAGALAQLFALIGTVVALFASYFIITLLLSLFGVVQVRAITALRYMNIGILLGAMVLAGAFAVMFYILLKKAMNVKASDIVRGNALIWTLLSVILSFAMPALSYLFAFTALLQLVVMLVYTICKDKYKARFNQDMERLFLYAWPMILSLPLMLPVVTLASTILSSMLVPVIMVLVLLMTGAILPYANYLKPALDKVAKKLPARTVRVQRTVTEQVEDEAKKGKFTTVTSKKIFKEKIERNYKNRFGIAVASVLAGLVIIFSASFVGSFNAYVTGSQNVRNIIYDGSIVYLWDKTDSGTSTSLVVKDKTAYKYFAPYVKGYKWNSDEEAFTKTYNGSIGLTSYPSVTKSENTYTFTPYEVVTGKMTITLTGTANVTEFTFIRGDEEVTYTNDGKDERVFKIPYGYGQFQMRVTAASGSAPTLGITYVEEVLSNNLVEQIDEIEELRANFADDESVAPYITTGLVFRYTESL